MSYEKVWRWIIAVAILLVAGWLWVSWLNGWFPFGAWQTPQTPQEILDSLTPISAPTDNSTDVLNTLETLTPLVQTEAEVNTATDSTTSILDSLTPQQ